MQLRRPKTLRKLSASPGICAACRRAIEGMLREMHKEVFNAVLEEYDAAEWRMARDSAWRSPSQRMEEKLAVLIERWNKRFGNAAMQMAKKYLKRVWSAVRMGRKNALAELGIVKSVNPSRFTSELYQALLSENVSLIKSIPSQYFERVEQNVQRSIAAGGDRAMLIKDLRRNYGVTESRARFIARGQTAKATQTLAESTDRDLGFTHGIWVHVPGMKMSPPPTPCKQ